MNEKTFFLGLGMGKAGSTWLYDYLCRHPEVSPGCLKEMHVIGTPEYHTMFRSIKNIPWHKFEGRGWLKQQLLRAWFRVDWNRYFDHFERCLVSDASVTGELAPSNMFADKDALQRVKKEFASRGIRVVAVFVMRDPVDRLYSNVRYVAHRRKSSRYLQKVKGTGKERFLDMLASETQDYYANYGSVLSRIESVFSPDDTFIELYEDLFQQSAVDRLTATLGIDSFPGKFNERINAAPKSEELNDDLARMAANKYIGTYKDVAALFGADRVKDSWPYSRFVELR